MPACSSARSSARSSGAAGACSGSSSTTGAARLQRLGDLLLGGADRLGQLGGRGQATFAGPDLDLCAANARRPARRRARGAHELGTVAQVVADLALDGGDGDRPQVAAAGRLEAVDGLDQADGAHLHEVVDGLAAACIAACDGAHEAHVLLDEERSSLLMPPRHERKVPARPTRLGELSSSITVVSSMVTGIARAARWHETSDGRCLRPVATHPRARIARARRSCSSWLRRRGRTRPPQPSPQPRAPPSQSRRNRPT